MSTQTDNHCVECGKSLSSLEGEVCPRCRRKDQKNMIMLANWWVAPIIIAGGIGIASFVESALPAWIGLLAAVVWFVASREQV